jgi:hypothetical protein
MHTSCRLFVHIDSSCADFLHTNSVLWRPFADLVHALSRVNVFHSNATALPVGPSLPFVLGEGAEVAVQWPPPPPDPTPLGEAAHEGGGGRCRPIGRSSGGGGCGCGRRHLRGRSAAVSPTHSIGYHCRLLLGLQGEKGRHARAGRRERA